MTWVTMSIVEMKYNPMVMVTTYQKRINKIIKGQSPRGTSENGKSKDAFLLEKSVDCSITENQNVSIKDVNSPMHSYHTLSVCLSFLKLSDSISYHIVLALLHNSSYQSDMSKQIGNLSYIETRIINM